MGTYIRIQSAVPRQRGRCKGPTPHFADHYEAMKRSTLTGNETSGKFDVQILKNRTRREVGRDDD
jgi:hypothetical protein